MQKKFLWTLMHCLQPCLVKVLDHSADSLLPLYRSISSLLVRLRVVPAPWEIRLICAIWDLSRFLYVRSWLPPVRGISRLRSVGPGRFRYVESLSPQLVASATWDRCRLRYMGLLLPQLLVSATWDLYCLSSYLRYMGLLSPQLVATLQEILAGFATWDPCCLSWLPRLAAPDMCDRAHSNNNFSLWSGSRIPRATAIPMSTWESGSSLASTSALPTNSAMFSVSPCFKFASSRRSSTMRASLSTSSIWKVVIKADFNAFQSPLVLEGSLLYHRSALSSRLLRKSIRCVSEI